MDTLEPRVTKREKKLHLSYEQRHRIYCSNIYPLSAPNRSTVLLYGHDRGLRVLWRGGRRPKEQPVAPPQANGISNGKEVIMIDDSDDEPEKSQSKDVDDQYEADEDEQDPDCPYPPIIQDLDMNLGTEVLHISIPSRASLGTPQTPRLAKTHIIMALGCADGRVTLMSIPLAPPKEAAKQAFFQDEVSELRLESDGQILRDLAIKVVPKDEQSAHEANPSESDTGFSGGLLLVAAIASSLNIWRLGMTTERISQSQNSLRPVVHAAVRGSSVTFQASTRQHQLLLSDRAGIVRIYDPFAAQNSNLRPSSQDSASATSGVDDEFGKWLMSYHTPFHSPKEGAALTRRKQILDAAWVLSSRAVLVLMEDGEWSIWDLSGPSQSGKTVEDFAIRGYLGSSSAGEIAVADSGKQRRGGSKLAPMTPNTRKARAEDLFSGTPKPPGVAATGGISINSTNNRSGQSDESVIMWYNNEIYSIPSMQAFWQRSTSGSSGGGFGSLYAPGLSHISDINLMNENITSISQFAPKSSASSLGQMNVQQDLLISAEYRFIILQSLRPPGISRNLLQQAEARPTSRDQRMLDAGDLDLGGMDRMLDSMAGDGRTRRVGFAH